MTTKTYVPSREFPFGAKLPQIFPIEFEYFLLSPGPLRGEHMGAPHSDQLGLWGAQSSFVSMGAERHCLPHLAQRHNSSFEWLVVAYEEHWTAQTSYSVMLRS